MPDDKHDDANEDDVRTRAYRIWEQEGRKDGEHDRHWRQAREEMAREEMARGEMARGEMGGEGATGAAQSGVGRGDAILESDAADAGFAGGAAESDESIVIERVGDGRNATRDASGA